LENVAYHTARKLIKLYFDIFHDWEVIGQENIPKEGKIIIMSNHISGYDPPLIGAAVKRPVHFMAKEELFSNIFLRLIMKIAGAFPVRRGRPDRKAIKKAIRLLENGDIVGIFPEGTRHQEGKPGKAKAGAVMLPLMTKSPILPIGIKTVNNKSKKRVVIGKPFSLSNYYNHKLTRKERNQAGEFIMKRISELLDN